MDNLITLYAPSSLKPTPDLPSATAPSASLAAHTGYISTINFFAGDKLFSTSGDGSAIVWDVNLQTATHAFTCAPGHGLTCGAPQPDTPAMFITCEVRPRCINHVVVR